MAQSNIQNIKDNGRFILYPYDLKVQRQSAKLCVKDNTNIDALNHHSIRVKIH